MKQIQLLLLFTYCMVSHTSQMRAQDLTKYGIEDNTVNELGGLSVGDIAPYFKATDHLGNEVKLETELTKGPVVLIFYRGYWCPICSRYLSELQNDLEKLKTKGARVLAISPEKTDYTKKTAADSGLTFPVLSDVDGQIMKDYKVFFRVTENYQDKVTRHFDFQLEETQTTGDANLPVPATYVIGQDGKISYVFYNPNYGKRAKVEEILEAL